MYSVTDGLRVVKEGIKSRRPHFHLLLVLACCAGKWMFCDLRVKCCPFCRVENADGFQEFGFLFRFYFWVVSEFSTVHSDVFHCVRSAGAFVAKDNRAVV